MDCVIDDSSTVRFEHVLESDVCHQVQQVPVSLLSVAAGSPYYRFLYSYRIRILTTLFESNPNPGRYPPGICKKLDSSASLARTQDCVYGLSDCQMCTEFPCRAIFLTLCILSVRLASRRGEHLYNDSDGLAISEHGGMYCYG